MASNSGIKFLMFLVVAVVLLLKSAVKNPSKEAKKYAAERLAEAASPLTPENRTRRGQKRMQMAQAELWRAAKHQQDDAEQLHSIRMDTCESKLESLRVLYDAGILDREEYAQRVARVKTKHDEA